MSCAVCDLELSQHAGGVPCNVTPDPATTYQTGGIVSVPAAWVGFTTTGSVPLTVYGTPTAAAPPKPLPADKTAEVIVGYRGWKLSWSWPNGVKLLPVHIGSAEDTWAPMQRVEARCMTNNAPTATVWGNRAVGSSGHDPSRAPHARCICGIYAHKDRVEVNVDVSVVGSVNLWGRVIEHERGYRAQFAYPKELVVVGYEGKGGRRLANELTLAYGVPCEVWE